MMGDRSSRASYVDMIPTLKRAIAFKRAEEEEQRDFRALLVNQMATSTDGDLEAAEAMVDELILWWKVLNKSHRSLVHQDDPELEARARR